LLLPLFSVVDIDIPY